MGGRFENFKGKGEWKVFLETFKKPFLLPKKWPTREQTTNQPVGHIFSARLWRLPTWVETRVWRSRDRVGALFWPRKGATGSRDATERKTPRRTKQSACQRAVSHRVTVRCWGVGEKGFCPKFICSMFYSFHCTFPSFDDALIVAQPHRSHRRRDIIQPKSAERDFEGRKGSM